MMDKAQREEVLAKYRPQEVWHGEAFFGSYYTEEEIEAAARVMRRCTTHWNVGFGWDEILEFEKAFAEYVGTEHCVAINGAGTGLDMSMMLLDLQPDDEVIVPAINFVAAPYAVIGQRGKLVLCEVDPKTLCADPEDVERRMTPRTRAILVTHMNGLSADMDALLEIAQRHPHPKYGPPKVIGDAARACGGGYKDTKIGKKGWMNIFSFHTMKNMTTLGEGGAITTDDDQIVPRLKDYRQFGMATGGWGTNYKMSNVQAAVGLVQLRRLDEMIAARRKVAQARTEMLKDIPELTLPFEPSGYVHSYYLYTILVPRDWAGEKRDKLLKIMLEEYNIRCPVLNPPVYEMRQFIRERTEGQRLPLSEELGKRIFCPPIHPRMTREENEYVCAAIIEAIEKVKKETSLAGSA